MAPDEWRPTATLARLRLRARMLADIRRFFAERGVMEVETPLLGAATATDPHLDSFVTRYHGPGGDRSCYLQTSPEFAMKRLLAAGSGPIYQIGKAFRNGEAGRCHNPEFTMLEWYRPGFDHHRLMDEVEALLAALIDGPAAQRMTYRALFQQHLSLDPLSSCGRRLRDAALAAGITPPALALDDRDGWLNLLLTHLIEPRLGHDRPVFVYDYPSSQAMLARLSDDDPPRARRFELYIKGMELANGFHELADGEEQQRRFAGDLAARRAQSLADVPMDRRLIAALHHGLPDCAGVALGVDRLVMFVAGVRNIADVVAFAHGRA